MAGNIYLAYLNDFIMRHEQAVRQDIERWREIPDYDRQRWQRYHEDIAVVVQERDRLLSLLVEIEQLQIYKLFILPASSVMMSASSVMMSVESIGDE